MVFVKIKSCHGFWTKIQYTFSFKIGMVILSSAKEKTKQVVLRNFSTIVHQVFVKTKSMATAASVQWTLPVWPVTSSWTLARPTLVRTAGSARTPATVCSVVPASRDSPAYSANRRSLSARVSRVLMADFVMMWWMASSAFAEQVTKVGRIVNFVCEVLVPSFFPLATLSGYSTQLT